jgi:hypothetical protein
MILLITVIDYDGTEKKVTLLFDSCDDWRNLTNEERPICVLGFFGIVFLRCLEHDMNVKMFYVECSQVIKGEQKDFVRLKPFVRDGMQFKRANVNRDGSIEFIEQLN